MVGEINLIKYIIIVYRLKHFFKVKINKTYVFKIKKNSQFIFINEIC